MCAQWPLGFVNRGAGRHARQVSAQPSAGGRRRYFHAPVRLETAEYGWAADPNTGRPFARDIDMERVDMERFPKWGDLDYYEVTIEAGDCALFARRCGCCLV
jgi:hypothetical protein